MRSAGCYAITSTNGWGLERLLARLQKRYGSELAWMTCSELAEG